MNISHEALHKLIFQGNHAGDFDENLEKNIISACNILNIDHNSQNFINIENSCNNSVRWKYISLAFHILLSLKTDESLISINYIHDVKKTFQFIVSLGILPNLIPGIGLNMNDRIKNIDKIPVEVVSVSEKYFRLSGTTRGLLLCLELNSLRNFILTNHFNDLLSALFQLSNAPIKKPAEKIEKSEDFAMTIEFYDKIMIDRQFFQPMLDKILIQSYSPQIIKELMYFYGNSTSPRWLKNIVYKILIQKLQQTDGVESLIKAVMDLDSLDTGTKWKQYDIIVKLLLTKPINLDEEYYKNICEQILNLLNKKNQNGDYIPNFTQIVSTCVKYLYEKDKNMCDKYFLNIIINKIYQYSSKYENKITDGVITKEVKQNILLLFLCFVETSPTLQLLPTNKLTSVIAILFYMFNVIQKSNYIDIIKYLKELLLLYLSNYEGKEKNIVFESLLFGVETNEIPQFNEKIEIIINNDNEIILSKTNTKIRLTPLSRSETLLELTKNSDINITIPLCLYLLEVSINNNLNLNISNTDLLQIENENVMLMNESIERKLVSYSLLSNIIENSNVQKHLQNHPDSILNFIEKTLKNLTKNNVHKLVNPDSDQFQNLFLLIMIINIITEENRNVLKESLKNILNLINNETINNELKTLILNICKTDAKPKSRELSEYQKALEDICDPLLPVRGHALMSLSKLIEEKDKEACANKQYILNISQQHLKNEDSYIYLNAIKVLAALGDSFPETILNILTEEYSNGPKELVEKNSETKMKIGEVLLRVVKNLGEMAPKYKSILLNTFLSGVKDEDHLIRASSLSNLGEVCRVLGFKLGSVVSEVLSCIHAVIATDKALEARRAAVSVIRYLFVGLEKETIVFLKEDILPIYRTLKYVYKNDSDDITRLQAQLALEELNENMRNYIFPTVKLENKIVMLE